MRYTYNIVYIAFYHYIMGKYIVRQLAHIQTRPVHNQVSPHNTHNKHSALQ